MTRLLLAIACAGLAVACGGDEASTPSDASTPVDGAAPPDAAADGSIPSPDAQTGPPLTGFGDITGQCGVLDPAILDGTDPTWFQGELTFADRYDDPEERPLLTDGGEEIILDGNAGGSSLYSEVFAFEWLARCELATLLATETEITYTDPMSKRADLLVELDGRKVGVSVTRAMTYPFGDPYDPAAATELIERKLDDLQLATAAATAADAWTTQLLAILAYDLQHAMVAMDAWAALDAETRGATILVVVVTSGDDMFIYTDR